MSINYHCTCESEQKYQVSTTKSHLCDCKPRKGIETHTISHTDYYHTCCYIYVTVFFMPSGGTQ